LLAGAIGAIHLSTGDIFRDAAVKGDALAKAFMAKGNFVPDEIAFAAVRDRLAQPDVVEKGAILDGFPRTPVQAELLLRLTEVERYILLDAPDDVLMGRAKGRRMDPVTGEIYNLATMPPPDEAASRLVARPADSDEAAFERRLIAFNKLQKDITPYFESCVIHVNACNDAAAIHSEILTAVSQPPAIHASLDDDGAESLSRGVSASSDPAAPPQLRVELCGNEAGPPGSVNAILTINCAELLTYIEGPHGSHPGETAPITRSSSSEVRIPDRLPVDVCCIIDVSGSMKSVASYEDAAGNVVDDGLTILDVVKHAVKTVMNILQDDDRLAIVAFSNKASLVLAPTKMCVQGRETGFAQLDKLAAGGQTNLWDGLLTGMEVLRKAADLAGLRQQSILLLTDGQPNIVPPNGHTSEFKDYKDKYPDLVFQVSTFGFGYQLDSDLLLELACAGDGTYCFVPDALIVGTSFVNSVANLLCVKTANSVINLTLKNGATFDGPVLGGFPGSDESYGRRVDFGPLLYGGVRDLVVPLKVPAGADPNGNYVEAHLTFQDRRSSQQCNVRCSSNTFSSSTDARTSVWKHRAIDAGHAACKLAAKSKDPALLKTGGWVEWWAAQVSVRQGAGVDGGKKLLGDLVESMRQQDSLPDYGKFDALLHDLGGRSLKALTGEARFKRWGGHYLRSLLRSHQVNQCTNFMDQGLQEYGGVMFKALRKRGDEMFLSLPPPKPSIVKPAPPAAVSQHTQAAQQAAVQQATQPEPDMSTYYGGGGGGCFGAQSLLTVLMGENEHQIQVCDAQAGHLVKVADGFARIRCVVRIAHQLNQPMVLLPGGLQITPSHPVRVNSEWLRPRDLPSAQLVSMSEEFVYNFVLDTPGSILLVNGIECVTLGHGLQRDVVRHPFYGSHAVITALESIDGWDEGFVSVECSRDVHGHACGFKRVDMAAYPSYEPPFWASVRPTELCVHC
jgi:adenylate kinase family enzyme/Mg-chelatase subunit ChlD